MVTGPAAAAPGVGRLKGRSNALCDSTSAPDTSRNRTGARNVPAFMACGVAACARSKL